MLIIGAIDVVECAASFSSGSMQVIIFAQGPGNAGGSQERRFSLVAGRLLSQSGWLGACDVTSDDSTPIDLDLCTRCNAWVAACPKQTIGPDHQVDMSRCTSHRDCVKVCEAAGAIDFSRDAHPQTERFDVVLDQRGDKAWPTFTSHALPQGYFRRDGQDLPTLLKVRELVGEFEKLRFLPTNKSFVPTAATNKWAAVPASTSAWPKSCARTKAACESWSTPTCAWAAALAPPLAPRRTDPRLPAPSRARCQDPRIALGLPSLWRTRCSFAFAQPKKARL